MASTPMFLGSDEVQGIFLGADEVPEMYLGTELVYQSGPFEGLKVSPKTITFNTDNLTASLKVKSSEQWSLTTPAWVSADISTGDTGETIVSLTATAQSAATSGSVVVSSENYSASTSVNYAVWEELAYIEDGTGSTRTSDYLIDTNYIPTTATSVEITLWVEDNDGEVIFATDQSNGGWYRFFTYQTNKYTFDCPRDSNARVQVNANIRSKNTIKMWLDNGYAYLQNGNDTPQSGAMPSTPNFTTSFKLWGTNKQLGQRTKIYSIKIYENQVLAMDLVPARVGTDIGLMDRVGGSFLTNQRSGILTYGELS